MHPSFAYRPACSLPLRPAGAPCGNPRWTRDRARAGPHQSAPGYISTRPSSSSSPRLARSTFLSNLPTLVFGISSRNANSSGSHHFATRPRRCSTQLVGAVVCAPSRSDHAAQRPLRPALVGLGDHRRLDDVRVGHQLVLQLDRGDPLAAGLDHVLGAVGDLHEALGVHRRDVARAQPPRVELLARSSHRGSNALRSTARVPRSRPSTRRPTRPPRRRRRSDAARPTAAAVPGARAVSQCASSCSPSSGRENVATGLVSVMPHAWKMLTPWRSSKSFISCRGTAEPPQAALVSEERSTSECSSA